MVRKEGVKSICLHGRQLELPDRWACPGGAYTHTWKGKTIVGLAQAQSDSNGSWWGGGGSPRLLGTQRSIGPQTQWVQGIRQAYAGPFVALCLECEERLGPEAYITGA